MAAGKIVLCFSKSPQPGIALASDSVMDVGGVGIIFAQIHDDVIPCIKVDYEVGTQILSYIRKAR